MQVVLGLGSNAEFNGMKCPELLAGGIFSLSKILSDIKFSSIYVSKAMYVTDQNDFYNMAVKGTVAENQNPFEFLDLINGIEAEFGRNRSNEIRFGPRSLDIDIEDFGNQRIFSKVLEVPHPRMKERAFVLLPMLEIFNESADELKKKELQNMLENLSFQEVKKGDDTIQFLFESALKRFNEAS